MFLSNLHVRVLVQVRGHRQGHGRRHSQGHGHGNICNTADEATLSVDYKDFKVGDRYDN